jgi:hypothetical protein
VTQTPRPQGGKSNPSSTAPRPHQFKPLNLKKGTAFKQAEAIRDALKNLNNLGTTKINQDTAPPQRPGTQTEGKMVALNQVWDGQVNLGDPAARTQMRQAEEKLHQLAQTHQPVVQAQDQGGAAGAEAAARARLARVADVQARAANLQARIDAHNEVVRVHDGRVRDLDARIRAHAAARPVMPPVRTREAVDHYNRLANDWNAIRSQLIVEQNTLNSAAAMLTANAHALNAERDRILEELRTLR